MRLTNIVLFAAAMFSASLAKVNFGPCPKVSGLTYSDYSAALGGSQNVYKHKLLYMDKTLNDLLGFGRSIVSQIPDLKCFDLFQGTAILYPDASTFNKLFVQPETATEIKLVNFDFASSTETMYFCVDNKRMDGIIDMIVNAGLPIPGDIIKQINQVMAIINFLNLTLRFDGIFVFSNTNSISSAVQTTISNAIASKVPDYSFSGDMIALDKSTCGV